MAVVSHCSVCIQIPLHVSGICGQFLGENGRYWSVFAAFWSIPVCCYHCGLCHIADGNVFCPQKQKNIAGALAFWMANASELLNFIKQDRDLSRITLDAQDVLAHLVQMAFK